MKAPLTHSMGAAVQNLSGASSSVGPTLQQQRHGRAASSGTLSAGFSGGAAAAAAAAHRPRMAVVQAAHAPRLRSRDAVRTSHVRTAVVPVAAAANVPLQVRHQQAARLPVANTSLDTGQSTSPRAAWTQGPAPVRMAARVMPSAAQMAAHAVHQVEQAQARSSEQFHGHAGSRPLSAGPCTSRVHIRAPAAGAAPAVPPPGMRVHTRALSPRGAAQPACMAVQ
mmetsp:Transcript_11770/g.31962  ORF Transcript_11770/g.31962 Transcript_11770/m.31962 type:complete len:224 (+) Transcript_11770:1-672(+)